MNTATERLHEQFDTSRQQLKASKLGMWTFLATEVLLFGALFCVYSFYRFQYPQGYALGSKHTDVVLGTIETIILLTSSLTMALAIRAIRLAQRRTSIALLLTTAAFGVSFLAIHATEYVHEWHEHLFPGHTFDATLRAVSGTEMFFTLYYVMTGLHALHVTIGLTVLLVLVELTRRNRFSPTYFTPVELGGLYWHLVDIVWIFLFPLFYLVSRT
ncbi:MAG TPA: cytochrome c oxidase subunit 3 family protein [Rudaea sp.]|nr:cytochrome c oxidase subunit 3 family protein [Rudaea sp.]